MPASPAQPAARHDAPPIQLGCPACLRDVRAALERVPGVVEACVDGVNRRASVRFTDGVVALGTLVGTDGGPLDPRPHAHAAADPRPHPHPAATPAAAPAADTEALAGTGDARALRVEVLAGVAHREVLMLVASVAAGVPDPAVRAIAEAACALGVEPRPAAAVRAEPGFGVSGRVGLRVLRMGTRAWLCAADIDGAPLLPLAEALAADGGTPLFVAIDGAPVAVVAGPHPAADPPTRAPDRRRTDPVEPVMSRYVLPLLALLALFGAAVTALPVLADLLLPAAHAAPAPREIAIQVNGRYTPDRVEITAGEAARLVFTRTEYGGCTREVVFPQLGIRKELPTNTPVTIDLPTLAPGSYDFHCGMKMIHGTLVVR